MPRAVEKKSTRAKKDPNAPKRGLSAFIFFTKAKRQEVLDAHPDIKFTEVTKEIAKLWKDIDDEEKSIYEDLAKEDKVRYEKEKAEYDAKKVDDKEIEKKPEAKKEKKTEKKTDSKKSK